MQLALYEGCAGPLPVIIAGNKDERVIELSQRCSIRWQTQLDLGAGSLNKAATLFAECQATKNGSIQINFVTCAERRAILSVGSVSRSIVHRRTTKAANLYASAANELVTRH